MFRCMYPGSEGGGSNSDEVGLGLLRLHSTFRHDLKIYASDEGRVSFIYITSNLSFFTI